MSVQGIEATTLTLATGFAALASPRRRIRSDDDLRAEDEAIQATLRALANVTKTSTPTSSGEQHPEEQAEERKRRKPSPDFSDEPHSFDSYA